ncbi:hypothetical protein CcaverHIS002_0506220 [Cutaneotrichosporon cavernicola]|uniref:Cyclin-like domain-containing protein n=1 Tax=Cutaneotrichosporon cavernicola TaxID=279322 RepID=A0AA48QX92_9TREE|nr:uncharacterized protein CcaverHIS019_0506750 [Cutaneotrichosporon cavernicola]BEI85221.1 hypothetical protein CcaverHIS002_0506220 [Cutaneotrichosporon cavernicola]BEI93047.1 hypothetical protein CcaverHIS019_0506750 [Cutaneotrichosporon cavernicola]BEJ00823.1 hypothetical protein CcaverHIS631_0506800 [Cutaneotrichosporon cavernicola]BEJ08590.1 hypothetical protein CcaverHIS641_0506840 [Cutaneotrichosporon cavernicola]
MTVHKRMRPLRQGESQWIFESHALEKTPSRDAGFTLEQELESRRQAILFMRSLWLRVAGKLHDTDPEATAGKAVLTLAAILVHRFYMRRSLSDFSPQSVAPIILFLASKVEEAPLKLRHIINATLTKFEPGAPLWEPSSNDDVNPQPLEYRRWEKEILATEEVVVEALCFDFAVDQPWPILRAAVRGIDHLWANEEGELANGVRKRRATEEVINELGWVMLNEGYLAPLPVLYRPEYSAFAVFTLILAVVEEMRLDEAAAAATELAGRFGLDIPWRESVESSSREYGTEEANARGAIHQYIVFCQQGVIERELARLINTTTTSGETYTRRFKVEGQANGNGRPNGEAI